MSAWKAALVALAGLGFASSACAQFQTDADREEIRTNRIRTIERRLYDPAPAGVALSGRLVTRHDLQGNVIESVWYKADGALGSRSGYKYDAGNRLVEYVTEPAHDVFQSFTSSYKLDQNGRAIEATYRGAGGKLQGSQRFTRDEAGRVVEDTSYDGAGQATWIQRKRYDSAGNLVEWTSLEGDGSVVQRREYTFRKKGQQLQMLVYDSNNRLIVKEECVYTGDRLSEERSFRADGTLYQRVVYERNAGGLVVKQTMFEDGKLLSVEETTYDYHP